MALQQIFSSSRSNRDRKSQTTAQANPNEQVFGPDEKDSLGETGHHILNRSGSSNSASSISGDICRICHSEAEADAPLLTPCHCLGSMRFVHQKCLQRWIKSSQVKSCELCKYEFQMQSKTKPFNKWEKLEMSPVERRKILCSVTFHMIAITCVIWSLYVLIDRTTEEIARNELEWPFWTKLIVVAIGFTGGVVFMYVQCKMYIQLCRRWKTYNRVIYIQTCSINSPTNQSQLTPAVVSAHGARDWSEVYQDIHPAVVGTRSAPQVTGSPIFHHLPATANEDWAYVYQYIGPPGEHSSRPPLPRSLRPAVVEVPLANSSSHNADQRYEVVFLAASRVPTASNIISISPEEIRKWTHHPRQENKGDDQVSPAVAEPVKNSDVDRMSIASHDSFKSCGSGMHESDKLLEEKNETVVDVLHPAHDETTRNRPVESFTV